MMMEGIKMKSLFVLLITSLFLVLSGCVNDTDKETKVENESLNSEEVAKSPGKGLKIAVVGNEKLADFENVSYQKRDLNYLSTNNEENFDALIVTRSAFEEADKEEYVEFFNRVTYPVFFIGTSKISISAFTNENTTLKQANVNQDAYAQGYINNGNDNPNKEKEKWSFHLPDDPKESDKNEKMLLRIFEEVEKHLE